MPEAIPICMSGGSVLTSPTVEAEAGQLEQPREQPFPAGVKVPVSLRTR